MSSNNAARGRRLELSADEDSSSSSSSSSAVVTVRTRPGVTPADQPPHPTTGATAPTARRSGRPHTPNRRLFDHEPAEEGGRRREHHRHEESASQRQRSASPRHRSASPPPPPLRRSGAEANVDDPMSGDGSEEGSADELLNYAANEISRRPAARSRTRWTQQMDVELLETVAEVGTGNWPRVLIVGHSYHKLTHVTGFSTLRRRYTQLRSAKSWLEKPPKVPPLKVPRNTPARQAAAIEQEHADAAAEAHKQWEYCVRLCMKIDARQESLGTGKKANQPTDEQALLQRARKKESVRNTAKDARNAHFQELVDKDAEIRSSLATSIEARTASGDRIGSAFEMMTLALLSKTLGADAVRELFAAPTPAARAAPAALAAPPARGDN